MPSRVRSRSASADSRAGNAARTRAGLAEHDAGPLGIDPAEVALNTVLLMSAMAPASAARVGPPPTTTNVSKHCIRAGSGSFSACSKARNSRLRISSARSRVFQAGRELLPFRMSEVAGWDPHASTRWSKRRRAWRPPTHFYFTSMAVGGRQSRGADLIKEWLEEVVVVVVDNGHLDLVAAGQRLGRVEAREPAQITTTDFCLGRT
jgi:hypothetical protein